MSKSHYGPQEHWMRMLPMSAEALVGPGGIWFERETVRRREGCRSCQMIMVWVIKWSDLVGQKQGRVFFFFYTVIHWFRRQGQRGTQCSDVRQRCWALAHTRFVSNWKSFCRTHFKKSVQAIGLRDRTKKKIPPRCFQIKTEKYCLYWHGFWTQIL